MHPAHPFSENTTMRLVSVVAGLLLSPAALAADHVLYLDFDTAGFDLSEFSATYDAADVELAKELIVYQVWKDYANVEVTVTREEPASGRYTRIILGGTDPSGVLGTVGSDTSSFGYTGTGIDSWEAEMESVGFVFTDEFAGNGAYSSLARITNAISQTASHEAGHILGLLHTHAYDDYPTNTSTNELDDHLMATGTGGYGLTSEERATLDRYFGHEVEAEILAETQQARGYHQALPDLDGDGQADLLTGWATSASTLCWAVGDSLGTAYDSISYQECSAGDAGDLFLVGDVDADGDSDLVIGVVESSAVVSWRVSLANNGDLAPSTEWVGDAGHLGDVFRLADVTGDGKADLLVGRIESSIEVDWWTFASTGATFQPGALWVSDAGDLGDLFFFGDVDADGDADMVYGRIGADDAVDWYVRRSTGSGYTAYATWGVNLGDRFDRFLLADVGGDGDADLVIGTSWAHYEPGGGGSSNEGSDTVQWYVHGSNGATAFNAGDRWSSDMGNPGDVIRLGDASGDGRADLQVVRHNGLLTAPVYVSVSSGSSFQGINGAWLADGGGEGWYLP